MKKGISTILVISITVIVLLGAAAGGWYYLNKDWESKKSAKEAQIVTLNKGIAEQKKSNKEAESAASAKAASEAAGAAATAAAESTLSTYTSTKYGYSFQYPKAFSLVDWYWNMQTSARVPQEGKVVWVSKTALSEKAIPMDSDPISHYFSVSIWDEACGLSQLSGDGIAVTDTTLLGLPAWKTNITDPSNMMSEQYETAYHVNKGSYCYNLTWVNSDATGTHDAEIDAMVASFKFL